MSWNDTKKIAFIFSVAIFVCGLTGIGIEAGIRLLNILLPLPQ